MNNKLQYRIELNRVKLFYKIMAKLVFFGHGNPVLIGNCRTPSPPQILGIEGKLGRIRLNLVEF